MYNNINFITNYKIRENIYIQFLIIFIFILFILYINPMDHLLFKFNY